MPWEPQLDRVIGPVYPHPRLIISGAMLDNEWLLAAVICAVPFVAFGLIEVLVARRRKRYEALARRSKSRS